MNFVSTCCCIALIASGLVARESRVDSLLPQEIAEFYRSYNSIASMSTAQERSELVGLTDAQTQSLNPRLRQILDLLQITERKILHSDRGMVAPSTSGLYRWIGDEVLEVRRMRADLDRIFVEVVSRPLNPDQRDQNLVASENTRNDIVTSHGAVGRVVRPASSTTTQIHQWVKRGDSWYVVDAKLQRLAGPSTCAESRDDQAAEWQSVSPSTTGRVRDPRW